MAGRPKRARTLRRELSRKHQALGRDRERLFALELGGSSARPIEVTSPSVIELRARSVPCPLCEGEQSVAEHAAVADSAGTRLREVRLRCQRCGSARSLWFRLAVPN